MALRTTMTQGGGLFGTKLLKGTGKTEKKGTVAKTTTTKKTTISKPAFTIRPPTPKAATVKKNQTASGTRAGGVGYKKYEGRATWIPNADIPEWLDGSMVGDRGFDPLGLAKPVEYLQVDIDQLDQNKGVNKPGQVIGSFQPVVDQVEAGSLQPYSEVFGIQRFRECELIHGRWAMMACLGVWVAEFNTGVAWQDAGKVELDGLTYFGFDLPFTLTQVVWIEAILMGGVEILRNRETDLEKRCYPGGAFDPLGLASDDKEAEKVRKLKEAEIKHARLAMVAFFGFGVQALYTGNGSLESLAKFADSF